MGKIRRFQQGGGIGINYATYTPMIMPGNSGSTSVSTSTSSGSGSSKNKDDDYGLDKDDIKNLLKDTLPSDSALIVGAYHKVINKVNQLENMAAYAAPGQEAMYGRMIKNVITNGMLEIERMREQSVFDKKLFDKYDSDIAANGATNDIAVDANGFLFYIDDNGKVGKCSLEESKDKRLMTYGDLQLYRSKSINGAFNSTIMSALSSSVSFKDIYTNIQNIINNIGEHSNERTVFGKKSAEYITGGLKGIVEDGRNGVYKIDITSKSATAEQKRYALETVIEMLPANQMTALKLRASRTGTSVEDIVLKMIAMHDKPTYKMDASLIFDQDKADAEAKKASEDLTKMKNSYASMITKGEGELIGEKVLFTNGGNNNYGYASNVKMIPFSMPNEIKKQTVQGLMTDQDLSKLCDYSSMSIGGVPVEQSMSNRFALANTNMYYMYMIAKNVDGKLVPDMERLDRMNDVNNIINKQFGGVVNEDNYEQVNDAMKKANIDITFGSDGEPNDRSIKRFIAFDVFTDIDTIKNIEDLDPEAYDVVADDRQAAFVKERTGVESGDYWFGIGDNKIAKTVMFMPANTSFPAMAVNSTGNYNIQVNGDIGTRDKHMQQSKFRIPYNNPDEIYAE